MAETLDAPFLAELQALHTGQPTPLTGKCGGYPYGDSLARGYVTIDVVNRCSFLDPADDGYFVAGGTGVASDRNVLTGEYFYVDLGEASAQSEAAVHVEAFPGHFEAGDSTFYRRYVGGTAADDREPLGTVYASRFLTGGAFTGGTRLAVWREALFPSSEPIDCGPIFGEAPIPRPFLLPSALTAFDEEENAEIGGATDACTGPGLGTDDCFYDLPWATQAMDAVVDPSEHDPRHLTVPFSFGRLHLTFYEQTLEGEVPLQGWVTAILSAESLYSVNTRGVRLDSACEPGTELP